MGLLTDPSAGQGRLTKILLAYHFRFCVLLYIGGVTWFCLLCLPQLNSNTYFSENALLPGLVKSEFHDEKSTRQYYLELSDEISKYKDGLPYPWLIAKFRQIGLDTYTHNFTLNYSLGPLKRFRGKNIYAILRAARSSSTESLVLSVPYRPPTSVHGETTASIAIMLAFAKFANKEKYWSKDIIFLITEHEQLGIQAWLEAYHDVSCGKKDVLDYGDLKGRAGAIQAAINLELHDLSIAQIDIKIEGLNGQLPNLDLFNLANRMCEKEGIYKTFKNRTSKHSTDQLKDWAYSFQTLLAMLSTQATGVPNGNHGLFHRFGIEALTLEGYPSSYSRQNDRYAFVTVGRILEGIYRSLNNLLERFHQSFFFYILPASTRFISIGLYIPSICVIAGTSFIKACALWCHLQKNARNSGTSDENSEAAEETPKKLTKKKQKQIDLNKLKEKFKKLSTEVQDDEKNNNLMSVGTAFILFHIIGVTIMNSPQFLTTLGAQYGFSTAHILFFGLGLISCVLLLVPYFVPFRKCQKAITILNILSLLELGTVLICISVNNFALALILGVVYIPFALIIKQTNSRLFSLFQKLLWILVHPLSLLTMIIMANTFLLFPNDTTKDNLFHGIRATMQAISFSVVDSMIYGNWLYNVVTAILLPNWLCFWCVLLSKVENNCDVITCDKEKKEN